jgi:hypothetical protein
MIRPLMVRPFRSTVMPSATMTNHSRAVEQVCGERGVPGDHGAAAQGLGQRRSGAERQRSEREDDDEDEGEVAGGMAALVPACGLPDALDPCKPA